LIITGWGAPPIMDQSEAPILDALVDYRKSNRYGFTTLDMFRVVVT
jgi:hypothetical protein